MNRAPQRVLVVVTRRIGDVLLATPLIRSLRTAWPGAKIEVLVFAGTEGVLAANPDINAVHTVPERPNLWVHLALALRLLRRYDLALSLLPGDRPTLYAWLAGRSSAGLLMTGSKHLWKQWLLDGWTPVSPQQMHTVRNYLELARLLEIEPRAEIVASWTDLDKSEANRVLGMDCGPYAVLHPYPKFRYKMWRTEYWQEVARWLVNQGFRVVLTGGTDAEEREYVSAIASGLEKDVINAAGQLSLGAVAALVSRASFFVGPDTAVTHIAAATGIPVIALFGPSEPVKWGPWPAGHRGNEDPWQRSGSQQSGNVWLVQGNNACVPCGLEGCDRHIHSISDCLLDIPASRVIEIIKTMAYRKLSTQGNP